MGRIKTRKDQNEKTYHDWAFVNPIAILATRSSTLMILSTILAPSLHSSSFKSIP